MKKVNWIMLGIILILGFLFLRQCSVTRDKSEELEVMKNKPDTIHRQVMKIIKPYKVLVKPDRVIQYKDTGRVVYKDLTFQRNSFVLFNTGSTDSLIINRNFLATFPNDRKLISMNLTNRSLDFQLLELSGIPVEERYTINLDKYNYRYVDNQLSTKSKFIFQLEPEVSYSFRPLHNLHDLDILLNFKTGRFNYKLGANGFLYPNFNQVGYDAKISVQYNFN